MGKRDTQVVVIGGGVAGLVAAGELARRGHNVTLLEARARLGGRVFTIARRGWPGPVELGAEFVHGGNRAFWRRLRQHRIATRVVPESHWRHADTKLERIADLTGQIENVTSQIEPRRMRCWSFAEFLRRSARNVSPVDRELARDFVEGFQAAPPDRMSAAAIADETLDTGEQCWVPGGYGRLVSALAREARAAGVRIRLETPVTGIRWRAGAVQVTTRRATHAASAAVVTLPLGVLQAPRGSAGAVAFAPRLAAKHEVIRAMEVGHVIRLTVRLDGRSWPQFLPPQLRRARGAFGFIHSRVEGVPVWWSLRGEPTLTGWAGGPAALKLAGKSERQIVARAVRSLADVLDLPVADVRRVVRDAATHNWSRDPFSRGAYSFIGVGQEDAAERLRQPIADTLFFAGEATADGEEVGTVHGALASGLRAAQELHASRRSG